MFSEQMVARHDDVTACGAKLIASQFTHTIDDGDDGGGSADTTLASMPETRAAEALPALAEGPLSLRFQAVDPEGTPLARRPYTITYADGAQHGGLTDAQGYAQAVETDDPEQLAVHFMFADVEGTTISREDLLP